MTVESGISSAWKKSTYSDTLNCVEVRRVPRGVEVRDSLNPRGPRLRFEFGQWDEFLTWVTRHAASGTAPV